MSKLCVAVVLLTLAAPCCGLTTTLTQQGIAIDAGKGGQFVLSYPAIGTADKAKLPSAVTVAGRRLSARYENGAVLTAELRDDGTLGLHFSALPDEAKNVRFDLPLPLALSHGGSFSIDSAKAVAFPAATTPDAFLFKGNARRLVIKPAAGDAFAIDIEHGWQQVQDNRVWHAETFAWMATAELPRVNGNESYYTLRIAAPNAPPAKAAQAAAPAATTRPFGVELGEKEIALSASTAGTFALSYPAVGPSSDKVAAAVRIAKDAGGASLTYAAGGTCRVRLDKGSITIAFSELPRSARCFRMEMLIPITLSGGGTYALDGGAPRTFPMEKTDRPFLYQGGARRLQIVHPTGVGFTVAIPPYSFQQLQDNRQWNWSIFDWWFATPLPEADRSPTFTVKLGRAGSDQARPIVDRFGQWMNVDFPTKVRSDAELARDAVDERQWLASLTPPATDPYGGMPGSAARFGLEKTGYFHLGHVARLDGKSADVLVTPDGNAFFQLGVCGISPCDDFTSIRGRESIYEWLPTSQQEFLSARHEGDDGVVSFYLANTIRKYGRPYDFDSYFSRWIDRLRAWGFNSAGAFTAIPPVVREKRFPYVDFAPVPAPSLGGLNTVWDPFAAGLDAKFDAAYAQAVAPKADDKLLIGYFISNEPPLEQVAKLVPTLRASQCPSKARLVTMLREEYGTIAALNAAWGCGLASFEAAAEQPLTVKTAAASDDMAAFFRLFLERRYGLVRTALRKHDPHHLLIGDRWTPTTADSQILVASAAKYLDLVSVNYYTYGIDKGFTDRVHHWAGKPLLFSEFYYSAADQGLRGGNKVDSQLQRGLAYRNYVEQSAATGYVVGIQWFLALDQACTGRFFEGFNGEAANTGLVNVADRPYKDFLGGAMETNYRIYDVVLGRRRPYALEDPRFHARQAGANKHEAVN